MPSSSLYGTKKPSKPTPKPLPGSTSLGFSSHLSSLISASRPSKPSPSPSTTSTNPGRPREKSKPDIFTAHHVRKNPRKRPAAEETDPQEQQHKTESDIGTTDSAALRLSKRRMQDKARLYSAMKRGDFIRAGDGIGKDGSLVDFDRKWAEKTDHDPANDPDSNSSDASNSDSTSDHELVEYTDSLSRTRLLTRSQIAREERSARITSHATSDLASFSAYPSAPATLIHGDTIQTHAFNPDADTSQKMADLAGKRDREATPPEERHYDANWEVRNRGTGFYQFSGDKGGREGEMRGLEEERRRTEMEREARMGGKGEGDGGGDRREKEREREMEKRRKLVDEHRSRVRADRFLAGLEVGELGGKDTSRDEDGKQA